MQHCRLKAALCFKLLYCFSWDDFSWSSSVRNLLCNGSQRPMPGSCFPQKWKRYSHWLWGCLHQGFLNKINFKCLLAVISSNAQPTHNRAGIMYYRTRYMSCCKILDVDRMLAKSATSHDMLSHETPQQQMENHPVIRTLYDHAKVRINRWFGMQSILQRLSDLVSYNFCYNVHVVISLDINRRSRGWIFTLKSRFWHQEVVTLQSSFSIFRNHPWKRRRKILTYVLKIVFRDNELAKVMNSISSYM